MSDQRMTELDDAIEQVLGRHIPFAMDRVQARNEICGLIAKAGYDVYAEVPAPPELRMLPPSYGPSFAIGNEPELTPATGPKRVPQRRPVTRRAINTPEVP